MVYTQPAIDCRTQKYQDWYVGVVSLAVAVAAIAPLTLLFILCKRRYRIQDKFFSRTWGVFFEPCE